MKILYRVCPIPSLNKPPVHADNKYELIKMCLGSFLKAKRPEDDIIFIADSMYPDWLELLKPHGKVIRMQGAGNVKTFQRQLQMAMDYDKVLLLEDDYLWRPDTLKHIDRALDELKYISPYDHPAHYLEERFDKKYETKLIDNIVYRDSPSNTLTFATRGQHIKDNLDIFMKWGIADHEMWQELPDNIWNPTYSMATHMVDGLLAPNVKWDLKS